MKYTLEKIMRIWNDQDEEYIEVGPHSDNPEWLEIKAVVGGKTEARISFEKKALSDLIAALRNFEDGNYQGPG